MIKDLIDGYFSVNNLEKMNIFNRILESVGIDSNIFKRVILDNRCYDIIVKSIYGITCEHDTLLNRPMNNLIAVLSNKEIDITTIQDCANSYCELLNTLLRRNSEDIRLMPLI